MAKPSNTLLLAVTGNSPQVVTETLYGIFKQEFEWPTQIKIITTQVGAEAVRLSLLVQGKLSEFCRHYELPVPHFSVDDILVITDAKGQFVDDARTPEDQTALADFITRQVAQFSLDPNTSIHASIAGGRKTMTFFLGYAMTIFGREYDRLSHVLVSEQFEGLAEFYYPEPHSRVIEGRNKVLLDTSKAEVMLAEIPFVSQRSMFGDAIKHFSELNYSELVMQIRLAQRPDSIRLHFEFDRDKPAVWINELRLDFSLARFEFAFYAMLARPCGEDDDVIERPNDSVNIALAGKALCAQLALLMGLAAPASSKIEDFLNDLQDEAVLDSRTVDSLLKFDGLNASVFDTRRNKLREFVQRFVPKALADLVLPVSSGQKKGYSMAIKPDQISFSKS